MYVRLRKILSLPDLWLRRRALRRSRSRWVKEPGALRGRNVCVLSTFSIDGRLSEHTLRLIDGWKAADFAVVLVCALENYGGSSSREIEPQENLDGLLIRENCGYDFGSWATAIARIESLVDANLLALANDSVYGPLHPLTQVVERVRAVDADVVGMTDSHEITHHLQSYLVFYKPPALRSTVFRAYWQTRAAGGRESVIRESELPLLRTLSDGGLAVRALFPRAIGDRRNPTLTDWRALIDAGFPFLKVELLRDNPFASDLAGGGMPARGTATMPAPSDATSARSGVRRDDGRSSRHWHRLTKLVTCSRSLSAATGGWLYISYFIQ